MIGEKQIRELEIILKNRRFELQSHDFNHLHRTAEGTSVFLGTDDEEVRNLAYVVGLLHEERTDQIQETVKPLGLSSEDISNIKFSVSSSREKSYINKNRVGGVVSFSNDILEGDGGFGVARTCHFCGEARIYAGRKSEDAIIDRFEHNRKIPKSFPSYLARLLEYQNQWPSQFLGSMKNKEPWATDMGNRLFLDGRAKHSLEDSIRTFDARYAGQQRFVKEAIDYLDGTKYAGLKTLVFPELS